MDTFVCVYVRVGSRTCVYTNSSVSEYDNPTHGKTVGLFLPRKFSKSPFVVIHKHMS